MGRYQITAPDGRIVTVEGAAPPTQEDAAEIFSRLPPKQTSPGVLERFNSRLPTAGITEVPGATADIVGAGPVQAAKSLAGGFAGTVGDFVKSNLAVGDTYTRMRERGQSPVYSAIASTPFLGPAADVITQDIVQGKIPEMAGDLLSLGVGGGALSKSKALQVPVSTAAKAVGTAAKDFGGDLYKGTTSPRGALGMMAGQMLGGPAGTTVAVIANTVVARRKRLAQLRQAADKADADLQAARDRFAMEQAKLARDQTYAEIAREEAALKAAEAAQKQAEAASIKGAQAAVKIEELAERTDNQLIKKAETAAVKAETAGQKLDLKLISDRAKQESKTANAVLSDLEAGRKTSFQAAGIEARILEASQKAEAAAQQELAVAQQRLRIASDKTQAKAAADLKVAQKKAEAAAERTRGAAARAAAAEEAAQIKREFRQRTQLDKQAAKEAAKEAAKTAPAPTPQTPPATPPAPAPGFTEMLQERVQAPVTAPKLDALGRTPEQRAYAAATTLAIKEIPWESAKTQLAKQHPGTPIDALEKAFKAAPKRLYETVSAHLRSGLTPTQAVKLLKENGLSVGGESSMLGHMKAELGAIGDKMTPAQRFEYTQLSRTKTAKGMKFKDLKPYEP